VSWYPNTLLNTALTLTRWGWGRGLRGIGECSSTLVGLSEFQRVTHIKIMSSCRSKINCLTKNHWLAMPRVQLVQIQPVCRFSWETDSWEGQTDRGFSQNWVREAEEWSTSTQNVILLMPLDGPVFFIIRLLTMGLDKWSRIVRKGCICYYWGDTHVAVIPCAELKVKRCILFLSLSRDP